MKESIMGCPRKLNWSICALFDPADQAKGILSQHIVSLVTAFSGMVTSWPDYRKFLESEQHHPTDGPFFWYLYSFNDMLSEVLCCLYSSPGTIEPWKEYTVGIWRKSCSCEINTNIEVWKNFGTEVVELQRLFIGVCSWYGEPPDMYHHEHVGEIITETEKRLRAVQSFLPKVYPGIYLPIRMPEVKEGEL